MKERQMNHGTNRQGENIEKNSKVNGTVGA